MKCSREDCVSWLKLERANSDGGVPSCCFSCVHTTISEGWEDNYEKYEEDKE